MMKQDQQIAVNTDAIKRGAERIKWLEDHWNTCNEEMGEIKTDIKWIKKFMWWIVACMVAGFSGIVLILINISSKLK